jgi:hypothetical protein
MSPVLDSKGEGFTMGALYWQLNDIWPGASWTSLEYGGKWKMSHYYAEKFFSHVLVSPIIDGDLMKVYVVCDDAVPEMMSLEMRTYRWNSLDSVNSAEYSLGEVCTTAGAFVVRETPLRLVQIIKILFAVGSTTSSVEIPVPVVNLIITGYR